MPETTTATDNRLSLVPLTVDRLKGARDMTVADIKSLFRQDSALDLESRKATSQMTEASVSYLKVARGLGAAINEILAESEELQKRWPEILAALARREDGGGADFKRKLASSGIPLLSGWAKKSIEEEASTNILEVLPDLLRQQWNITQKAADRIRVQKTLLVESQTEAEEQYRHLGEEIIRLREAAALAKSEFDETRKELAGLEQKLKENEELEDLVAEGKPLPEGKAPLGNTEYEELIRRRTEIMVNDDDREVALQTTTQEFRASKDGYRMTEIQIGELAVTHKAINAVEIMLNSFLKVTRPIMMRSIVILNSQSSGLKGAMLLQALGQTMNDTLRMCAYGMTVMTEQAVALGRMDFLEPATVEEVKKIQASNDAVWNDFTKDQYALVMQKAQPLLEHKELNE